MMGGGGGMGVGLSLTFSIPSQDSSYTVPVAAFLPQDQNPGTWNIATEITRKNGSNEFKYDKFGNRR